MVYNSLKSYWIWRRKKEAEEKEWRALGVDENIIEEIIEDRSYQEVTTVEQLLDEVESPAMYKILKKTSEKTLQILLMRVRGYSVKDITEILHLSKTSVYKRIKNVREKLNKVR